MATGRVSATPAAVATAVTLLCLLVETKYAGAATYTAGDAAGWSYNVVDWPKGKSFKAGDVLVFKYNHNVVVVDKEGYTGCSAPSGAKSFTSGKDEISLSKGQNYFICSFPGHCKPGMLIAINAA